MAKLSEIGAGLYGSALGSQYTELQRQMSQQYQTYLDMQAAALSAQRNPFANGPDPAARVEQDRYYRQMLADRGIKPPESKPASFIQELQRETDEWLNGAEGEIFKWADPGTLFDRADKSLLSYESISKPQPRAVLRVTSI